MKKRRLIAALILSLVIFNSCKKNKMDCDLIPAKIIRYDCDRVIFQLLTTKSIGDANWKDVITGQEYSNVVSFNAPCKISALTNGEKLTLYVRVEQSAPDAENPDCYRCQAVSQDPPQTKVGFAEISTSACKTILGN